MNENKPYKFPFTILTLDAETRWDRSEYTLSKMTTEEYIRDPRFHVYGMCIHEYGNERKTQWYRHDELENIFSTYDWSKTAILCQNAMFDGGILAFRYNVFPVFYLDTLCMARALRGPNAGNSLAKLAEHYGQPPKGHAVNSTEGLGTDLPAHVEAELAEYCVHDVALTEAVFGYLLHRIPAPDEASPGMFPLSELKLIDMTIKMYTQATLNLDKNMLQQALDEDNAKLSNLLERTGVEEAQLSSNIRFAALLDELGITPPTKTSKITGKEAFALAKSDAHFQALLNGEREDIALLCEARLRVKSTSERTRAQRFIDISNRGTLPIPLSYYGAATGRWSGTQQINLQNMKRGSALRKAIMAPEGYQIIAGDLSQIEPRVLAWLADYNVMLDTFRAGGDPYATFGSQMFSIPGLTKESHPLLRQSAKSALLGAGYALGWASFAAQLLVGFLGAAPVRYTKEQAKQLGVTKQDINDFCANKVYVTKMNKIPHTCTEEELLVHCLASKAIIDKYRRAAEPVTRFWRMLGDCMVECLYGGSVHEHKGVLQFRKGEIEMVNGMCLRYPELNVRRVTDPDTGRESDSFSYFDGKMRRGLHHGVLANNCLAGDSLVLTDSGWVTLENVTVAHLVHDGVDFVQHYGIVCNGVQACIALDGVWMTPDHRVLTDVNWTCASELPRPYRPDLRHVDGASTTLESERELAMAVPLQLRKLLRKDGGRSSESTQARRQSELRVSNKAANASVPHDPRHDPSPLVHLLAQHAQSVLQNVGACVQELWGKGHHGVQSVARQLRELLGGHGRYVPAGSYAGAQGQQWELRAGQLLLGHVPDAGQQQALLSAGHKRTGVGGGYGDWAHNDLLSSKTRMASGPDRTSTRNETVYDIVNCGPRSRFVVLGAEGPFIVHNCVQGLARVVMSDGMLRVAKRLPVKGTVHDELLTLSRDECVQDDLLWVKEMMIQEPSWLPGIPLNADVGANKRYGLAKV